MAVPKGYMEMQNEEVNHLTSQLVIAITIIIVKVNKTAKNPVKLPVNDPKTKSANQVIMLARQPCNQ